MAQVPIIISRVILNGLVEGIAEDTENAGSILSTNIERLADPTISNSTISIVKTSGADYDTIIWYSDDDEKLALENRTE